MLKKIIVTGILSEKYGITELDLDVMSVSEALRGINANYPGFLMDGDLAHYNCLLVDGDDVMVVEQYNCVDLWSPTAMLVLVPVVDGEFFLLPLLMMAASAMASAAAAVAGAVGAVMGAAGAALSAAGTAIAGAAAGLGISTSTLVSMAVSLTLSVVSSLVQGGDKSSATPNEKPNNKPSYIFSGPVNTMRQGHPMPLLYGQLTVGSMVLSVEIDNKKIPVNAA